MRRFEQYFALLANAQFLLRDEEHFFEQLRQRTILDQLARNPDPLIIAHQMGRGGDVDAFAVGLQHGAKKGAG